MTSRYRKVALIPARSGSKRVKDKNVKLLNGHPLIAYTISAAIDSNVFDDVICATDSAYYADIARYYGAEVPLLRESDISTDVSPDIDWVRWILNALISAGREYDIFSILRPTSPFRSPETIKNANLIFMQNRADSLRAVEKCRQHPGKMWVIRGNHLLPVMPFSIGETPWHSNQYAALPEIYVQNASLEFAWTKLPIEHGSIAGETVLSFVSEGLEGFDINDPEDWMLAEYYLSKDMALLPSVSQQPYKIKSRD